MYIFVIILVVNLLYWKRLYIDITPKSIRVQMPKSNNPLDIEKSLVGKVTCFELPWEDIREVQIRKLRILFNTGNGPEQEFALVHLFYREIQRLKSTLITLAKAKNVPVRIYE